MDSRLSLEATLDVIAPVVPAPRWKFWGTTLWALAIMATFVVITIAGLFAMLVWLNPDIDGSGVQINALLRARPGLGAAVFVSGFVGASAVLALAVRLSGVGMREYLGLVRPDEPRLS